VDQIERGSQSDFQACLIREANMKIQFTFKHMPTSQSLVDLAEEKLEARIEKFTSRPVHTHVTFSVEGISQKVHVSLITSDGHNIEADHSGEDMYAEIDIISEKVESQLRKHKERLKAHDGLGLREISKKISMTKTDDREVEDSLSDDAIDASDILNFEKASLKPLQPVCNG
jgi:putative sigma-54 modulation protein